MKIATGIPGFDSIVNGGFDEGTTNLIAGETGTCKSIFCMQFLYNRASMFKEKVYYVTTEDGVESIHKQAEQFGWQLQKPPISQLFRVIELEPYNINAFLNIAEEIKKNSIKRVVIDSVSVFEIYMKEPFIVRKNLFSIIEKMRAGGTVTLMTAEVPGGSKGFSRSGIVEFMADSIIRMQYIQEAKAKRSLVVKKMRFSPHGESAHPFEITKKGLVVK